MSSTRQSVQSFLDRAPGLRILVVGDVMLDTYVSGHATRISPEAPVPVIAVSDRRYLAGGAANVAANIRALGANASLAGVAGPDSSGAVLRRELQRTGIDSASLIEDQGRVTTTKTRITASGQQIVRFDEEDTSPLSASADARLRSGCEKLLGSVHACVVSDYAKGVASEAFCRWLIGAAAQAGKPVVVDPKSRDLSRYRGAAVITPNLKETSAAAGEPIHDAAELAHAAARLIPLIAPSALLVTQGGDGMSLFQPESEPFRIPALPVEVADVTGAGDTVVAVLAIALGMGMGLREAAALANLAAGIAVRHTGTWAVNKEELLADSERIHQT
jgi:D-beta-D-heptose 7-phosphate kinase/D-beta-D-heptose 1-phosphate adenosyltransferase